MKFLNKTVFSLILTLVFIFATSFALAPTLVHADAKSDVCAGVGLLSGNNCNNPSGSPSVDSIVATVVNILSIVVGIIAVIMIIIGGIRFVLSGGDSNATTSARNTVLYALVGLVVAALAQVLARFVLNKL